MLKKMGFTAVALFGLLVMLNPAPADAQVRFGVAVGVPASVYRYAAPPVYAPYDPYYVAPAYPYYPAPYYAAPVYGYGYGFGYGYRGGYSRPYYNNNYYRGGGYRGGGGNYGHGGGGHHR